MGTTWTCIILVGTTSRQHVPIPLLLKMVGDIKISHLIEVQHIQIYWNQLFFLLESVLHFRQPHSPPGSPSQSPSTKRPQIPFTYIALALACQISSLLSQISLSPFKISLTNPSNLLFCTGKVNFIHAIKRGVEVYLHSFLTSALDGGEWSGSCPVNSKARKSVPCILYLEARWAPELLCTFLRAERYFAPTGN